MRCSLGEFCCLPTALSIQQSAVRFVSATRILPELERGVRDLELNAAEC